MQPINDTSYLFDHVSAILHRQSDQVLQEQLGIGLSQLKILTMLKWRPGATQKDSADYLGQTEASISRQIKILQQKGLLASHIDPAERRRHLAALTTLGIKITMAAHEVLNEYHAPMLDRLNPRERELFHTMLTTLHEYTCAPGKRLACDRPNDIETVYATQTDAAKN
jgi:DNA-binding MarR family transcriptional regulator